MFRRDPKDKGREKRLAGSYILSLLIHAIAVVLFFSVTTSSSEQASSDALMGGEIVSVSRQAILSRAPFSQHVERSIPHAARIAPPQNRPRAAAQRQTRMLHELAKTVPSAPPNGYPVPVAPESPIPQATQVPLATPNPELPAVPISVPKAVPVAVAIKQSPTEAPSPVPSAAPSAQPSSAPAAPSTPPATVRPTAAPQIASATAKPVSLPPRENPAPATSPPQPKAGIPSPGPTTGPLLSHQAGNTQNPGPKAIGKPRPKSESRVNKPAAPAKLISIPATPSPEPSRTPAAKNARANADLNARLKALIPNNPVHVTQKIYAPGFAAVPTNAYPTPPPEVLALTKFIMDSHRRGESVVKMWVTGISKRGPLTICTGWLYRVPLKAPGYIQSVMSPSYNPNAANYPGPQGEAGFKAVVEPNASFVCAAGDLTPFVAP